MLLFNLFILNIQMSNIYPLGIFYSLKNTCHPIIFLCLSFLSPQFITEFSKWVCNYILYGLKHRIFQANPIKCRSFWGCSGCLNYIGAFTLTNTNSKRANQTDSCKILSDNREGNYLPCSWAWSSSDLMICSNLLMLNFLFGLFLLFHIYCFKKIRPGKNKKWF